MLQPALRKAVEGFCTENHSTAFRVLGAAFNVLLACYSGQDDICVGTPVTPPLPAEIEPLIGLFSYTVVVRTQLSDTLTFSDLCSQVGASVTGAIRRALPFDLIVNAVQPPRDTSRMLLFQANLRVRQAPLKALSLSGLEVTAPEWVDTYTSKFDLSFEIVANGGPGGFVEYRTDLFDEATIARLAGDFYALTAVLIRQPDCPLGSLPEVQSLKSRFRRFKPQTPRTFQRGAGIELAPAVA